MSASARRLLLVGAGHAHLEVLRAAALQPFNAELVVVSPSAQQIYSGMMPGQLSGAWPESALTVNVPALCRAAGARFIETSVEHIEATVAELSLTLANGTRIDGTHASCDIGAMPSGLELRGVREFAHRTRPLPAWRTLIARAGSFESGESAMDTASPLASATLARAVMPTDADLPRAHGAPRCCVVVGGGAAGVELAFALAARRRRGAPVFNVSLLSSTGRVPTGFGEAVERRVRGLLADRGVRVVQEATVREVTATEVTLDDGRTIPSEFTVWTTGAAAPALFRTSSLPCDADGFLAVDETLRATSGVPVWGAGDCISMASAPWMTRSGVYAVRAAPVLAQNLRLACAGAGAGARPRVFVPQRHTLFILDTADGRALFCRRSIAVHARWALSLKRWIDRRFVLRYAVG